MKFHPLCELFPLMPAKELKALADDITRHGLREPILIYDGQIIDGRNRIRACELARVEPEFKKFDGSDPKALVASLNLHRRHLNAGQRAMLAVKILDYVYEKRGKNCPSVSETAKVAETSARTAKNARRVNRSGSKDLKKGVLAGTVPLADAATVADLPKKKQMAALKDQPKPKPEPDNEEAAERATVKSIAIDLVEKVREEICSPYASYDARTAKAFAKNLTEKMEAIL